MRYYDVVQSAQKQLGSAAHLFPPRPPFHPALVVHSSPGDQEVAYLSWEVDLTGSAQAARGAGWALDQARALACEFVTVGRGEELARWDCLYEDSPTLVDIGFGIAPGTEPSAAD